MTEGDPWTYTQRDFVENNSLTSFIIVNKSNQDTIEHYKDLDLTLSMKKPRSENCCLLYFILYDLLDKFCIEPESSPWELY